MQMEINRIIETLKDMQEHVEFAKNHGVDIHTHWLAGCMTEILKDRGYEVVEK